MFQEGERGNVTIMALIVFLVAAILVSGLFIVPSALSFSNKHTNMAQAQYAAEAGVKRVVAACEGQMSSWDWIGDAQDLIVDGSPTYKVRIIDESSAVPAWVTSNATPTAGTYTITSIGKANGSSKTVAADINITNGAVVTGNAPNATLYADGDIESSKNLGINTNGLVVQAGGDIENITTSPSADLYEKTSTTIPEIDYDSYMSGDPTPTEFELPSGQNYYLSESDGKYYYDGDLNVKCTQNLAIYGNSDYSIIVVKGDVNFDGSNYVINFNNPVIIVAIGGDVTITNASCAQVAVLAMKDGDDEGGDVYINNSNLNGTLIMAEGDITLNNVGNCNSNQALVTAVGNCFDTLNSGGGAFSCTIQEWRGE